MTNRWFLDTRRAARSLCRASLLACAALLCCLLAVAARPARAVTTISTDTTINYAINDFVAVTGSPTVALVSGGSIARTLDAYDSSTLNLSGGTVAGYLSANQTSTVNLSAGSIGYDLSAKGTSTVNVSGGSIGRGLFASDTSTVNLSGGSIEFALVAYDSSTLNLSAGSVAGYLAALGTSTVNLSGGSIAGNFSVYGSSAVLNVYGTGLSLSGAYTDQDGATYYVLAGTLADGTAINNRVYLLYGAQLSQINLVEVNPFPPLRQKVQALAANGTLSKGNANALLSKLSAAEAAAAAGDTQTERDALTAFINQVRAFVRTGKLSAAQSDALIAAAQTILDGMD